MVIRMEKKSLHFYCCQTVIGVIISGIVGSVLLQVVYEGFWRA